jgi:hypothetical protein
MKLLLGLALLVVLSGCASVSNYCHERPVVCASVSALVVAGIVMSVSDGDDDKSAPPANKPPLLGQVPVSDTRLKRDIRYAETLPNGIRLHTFRYWNDSRVFVGVMAQELLRDARYRHAVHQTEKGYYTVDLATLGLRMDGAVGQYSEAGEAALREATPL